MSRPRLLDLFSGAGGAAVGYHRAGFEIVGVDIKPQPNYPFTFYQYDALEFLREWIADGDYGPQEYCDAIHASPPCQAFSVATADKAKHQDLITPLRPLLVETGLPYVIENVPGAPLLDPVMLCGSSFSLGVRRHRMFETNWPLMAGGCAHGQQEKRFRIFEHGKWRMTSAAPVFGSGGRKAVEDWPEAMGIDWMTRAELAEAIPPAYTEFIGTQLLAYLGVDREAARILSKEGK